MSRKADFHDEKLTPMIDLYVALLLIFKRMKGAK